MSRGYLIPIGGAEEKFRDPAILKRFADVCGGSEARIVIIPTASRLEETGPRYVELFQDFGVAHAVSLPFEERSDCAREDWLQWGRKVGSSSMRLRTYLPKSEASGAFRMPSS